MGSKSRYASAAIKTASHRVYETVRRPKSLNLQDVPSSVKSITNQWLTQVLCGEHPQAQVISFVVSGGSSGTHDRRRLEITYNDAGERAGLPVTVFTKSLPSLLTRMLVGHMGHSRFEKLFYQTVRPQLKIETPICYYSGTDKRSLAAIHVLEDVATTKNAEFCDHTTIVTREMAEGIIDLLADMHGTFYAATFAEQDLGWIVDYPTWFSKGVERVHTDRYLDKALDLVAHLTPRYVQDRRAQLWEAVERGVSVHNTLPKTIVHNDVHIGNWYYTNSRTMGLLDWQCVVVGHWSRDVSYALASSLRIADRREWEGDLLKRYLARLEAKTGVAIEFDEAWTHYRQQMLHALTNWTQTLCHPVLMPDSHPEALTYTMLERILTAVSDLESIDVK